MIISGSATRIAATPSAVRSAPASRWTIWWSGSSPGPPTPTSPRSSRDLGIGYLWVTGAGEDVISRIDNTPGLGTASGNEQGTVWQLDPPVARTVLVDGAARVPLAGATGHRAAGRRRPDVADR